MDYHNSESFLELDNMGIPRNIGVTVKERMENTSLIHKVVDQNFSVYSHLVALEFGPDATFSLMESTGIPDNNIRTLYDCENFIDFQLDIRHPKKPFPLSLFGQYKVFYYTGKYHYDWLKLPVNLSYDDVKEREYYKMNNLDYFFWMIIDKESNKLIDYYLIKNPIELVKSNFKGEILTETNYYSHKYSNGDEGKKSTIKFWVKSKVFQELIVTQFPKIIH